MSASDMHRSGNRRAACVLAMLLLCVGRATADGWTQPRGMGYYQFRFEMVRTSRYFEPNGNRIAVPTVGAYRASLYGEYGVTGRLTVVAYVPLERVTLNRQVGRATGVEFDPGDSVTGLADAVAGIRVGLLNHGRTVLSASVMIGIPIGDSHQESGLYTGDGELNQTVGIEFGQGFGLAAYLTLTAGWNNRTQGFSDEFVYRAEVGTDFPGRFSGALRVGGIESTGNGGAVLGGRGLRGNDQRMLRYGAELRFAITDAAGVAISVDRGTRLQNALGGTTFGTSLFARL